MAETRISGELVGDYRSGVKSSGEAPAAYAASNPLLAGRHIYRTADIPKRDPLSPIVPAPPGRVPARPN